MSKSLAVVIASCREESMVRWLEAWKEELHDVPIYLIEDNPKPVFKLDFDGYTFVSRWSWEGIDRELAENSWIIPRRTSAIKSFGFLKAVQDGHDYIWTLDDDCFPEKYHAQWPYKELMKHRLEDSYPVDSWYNTLPFPGTLYPRGYPYGIRQDEQPVMIHHGMWSGVPDLDGITALEHHRLRLDPATGFERVPTGQMFAMCGMNLAFRAEMAPAMYFGLQGRLRKSDHGPLIDGTRPLPFDRFDDIWAGLFAKKVADHLGYAVTTGSPSIIHTKESDPTQRVIKEGPGIAAHELLWPKIAGSDLHAGFTTVKSSYSALADRVDSASYDEQMPFPDYWKKLAEAMKIWQGLF